VHQPLCAIGSWSLTRMCHQDHPQQKLSPNTSMRSCVPYSKGARCLSPCPLIMLIIKQCYCLTVLNYQIQQVPTYVLVSIVYSLVSSVPHKHASIVGTALPIRLIHSHGYAVLAFIGLPHILTVCCQDVSTQALYCDSKWKGLYLYISRGASEAPAGSGRAHGRAAS
jgi:hypothetical protein